MRKFSPAVLWALLLQAQRRVMPFGRFTDNPLSWSVCEDSLFDVASITKSIINSVRCDIADIVFSLFVLKDTRDSFYALV